MVKHSSLVRSAVLLAATSLALAGCSSGAASTSSPAASSPGTTSPSTSPASTTPLEIAYMSFAVANSYDAPMLAAAQAEAASSNATLTVFDANNDPQVQFTQLQNAIASGKYQGIITQPILGPGLVSLVEQAIAKGIKVVNIDQILGADLTTDKPQVTGLSANVTFVPTTIGQQLGEQVVAACAADKLDPCNVGYLYDIKASSLDIAIHKAFVAAISATPSIKVVAEGEDFFTPAVGLTAVQNMLQSNPDMNLIAGSDQGLEGAIQALAAAKKTVAMVGFGASEAGIAGVKSGAIFSEVAQMPASEGKLGVRALIAAIRTGTDGGAINPVASLPNNGIVTKATATTFAPEWAG
ncbi:sugar ABC transporter substrate-binding protein [Demequina lutea]|uniref:Ribose transport system substrate-binding protein n=1 Tax=Demequina lutea TaxID=431489 RepID=A0A7Y9Z7G5_9MICO|nr:sugar ABC transporter substrate-binding protein [Demequina lutea]NYI40227.1 ribose transport system substrate-binding protein [Demequina lutea]